MSQRARSAHLEAPVDEPTVTETIGPGVHGRGEADLGRPTRGSDYPSAEGDRSMVVPAMPDAERWIAQLEEPYRDTAATQYDEEGPATLIRDGLDDGRMTLLRDADSVDDGQMTLLRDAKSLGFERPKKRGANPRHSDTGVTAPRGPRASDEGRETLLRDARALGHEEDVAIDDVFSGPASRPESETRAKAEAASPARERGRKEGVWEAVEARYRAEGHWTDLVEMYLQRVETVRDDAERARLFVRIATVMEDELEDAAQALDAWVEALVLVPRDDETTRAIERIAAKREWWPELFSTLKRELRDVKRIEREVALCEHAIRWARDEWKQPAQGEVFVERLRKVDPDHPIIQRQVAARYAEQGNFAAQRDALDRVLVREQSEPARAEVLLAIGTISEARLADHVRATEAYEAALAIDPRTPGALDGLERICRAEARYADLASVLERQVGAAPSALARAGALVRLAEVHESHFVRPQHAAGYFEEAARLDRENEVALAGLERCHTAARAWPSLVTVLERRVERTASTRDQVALIGRIAELLELKVGDHAGASRAWQRAWDLDPANEQAVWELARLAERASDWPAVAAFRAKLADLAVSPEASAKIHVAIGELLDAPDRDPALARKHFEKAVSIHPATTPAWEALERAARAEGDTKRVGIFLEKRAASTEAPRQKAQLFVELADLCFQAGDAPGAELAYERAIKADATNPIAAEAMLAVHVRNGRWAEAQPLCDLLLSGLTRESLDERGELLLRTATQIARERGQTDRTVAAAVNAWRARPTIEAAGDLVDACFDARTDEQALAQAGADLDAVVARAMELGPARIARLARIRQAQWRDDEALQLFSQAVTHDSQLRDALEGLGEILIAHGDFERACGFKSKVAHLETEPEAQYKLLVEVGELWAHRAKNVPMATLAFEEALALKPEDSWLLHTLLWAYGELECWEKVLETLERVTKLHEDPANKSKSLYAMALVVRDRLNDPARSARLLEEVLDLDAKRLDAFERVVRIHTELRDWVELKQAYGRMLRRLKPEGDVDLKHALFFQLGLIYRDRLGDAARALDAFRAAERMKAGVEDVRKSITELLIVTDQLDDAIGLVRTSLKKRPGDAAIHRELYSLFLRKGAYDQAWGALDAIATLGMPLDGDQARFYSDFPPPALAQIPGTLTPAAWRSHLVHTELDATLTRIFALVTPILLRAKIALLPFQALRRSLGEPLEETSTIAHEVIRAVTDGAEIVALPSPTLHLREGQEAPLMLAPAKNAIFVSLSRCEALPSDALAFVVGKRLAEMRPEVAARAACPTHSELKALVMLAVQLADETRVGPATGNPALDKAIVQAITREEQLGVRAAVNAARTLGPELDVSRWAQLADASTSRAGLLLAGRIEAARRGMLGDSQAPGDLPMKDRLAELMTFGVSDAYAELRQAIGVSVAANAAA